MHFTRSFFIVITFFLSFSVNAQSNWSIDNDYTIAFDGTGAEGTFRGLSGTIRFSPDQLDQAYFDVSLNAKTIDTGNNLKNKHARDESWFSVVEYPEISYQSSKVMQDGGNYVLDGILTLRGESRKVPIPFSFVQNGNKGTFRGNITVDRTNFGIMGPIFGFLVGDEFTVNIEVPVTRKDASSNR